MMTTEQALNEANAYIAAYYDTAFADWAEFARFSFDFGYTEAELLKSPYGAAKMLVDLIRDQEELRGTPPLYA